ncbi:hypothetical protein FGO68_gene5921 [Halteria grandinella]|uniref:Uncharacterized protein n=1 Tax=Halteria grandinella TaxID=5974 RepID=A0A8J8NZR2_HALGN|nr:hypothetical protein FGO68_gene5921 [Halteria grandinella]
MGEVQTCIQRSYHQEALGKFTDNYAGIIVCDYYLNLDQDHIYSIHYYYSHVSLHLQHFYHNADEYHQHNYKYYIYTHLVCPPILLKDPLQFARALLQPRACLLCFVIHLLYKVLLRHNGGRDVLRVPFKHVGHLYNFVEHFVNLLVIGLEFLHQTNLIVIHVSEGVFIVIHLLIFFHHLLYLLPRFEYHLILDVGIRQNLDPQFTLLERVLVIEQILQHLQVVLDALQSIIFVCELLWRILLLALLSKLGLKGKHGLEALCESFLNLVPKHN